MTRVSKSDSSSPRDGRGSFCPNSGAMNMPFTDGARTGRTTMQRMRGFTMTMAGGGLSVIIVVDTDGRVARYSNSAPSAVRTPGLPQPFEHTDASGDTAVLCVAVDSARRRFHALLELSPFSTQVFSPDGWTIAVNKAWQNLWGATPEWARSYNVLRDAQLVEKGIMPYFRRGFAGEATAVPAMEYVQDRNEGVSGARRWVRAYINPIMDDGQLIEVVLMHEDVTAQKHMEALLLEANELLEGRVQSRTAELAREVSERKRAEQERMEATLRSIGDGVITTDAAGTVLSMNPVAESLTAWSEQDARGLLLQEVFKVVDEEPRCTPTAAAFCW